MQTVHVQLGERSYPIHIGPGARWMLWDSIVSRGNANAPSPIKPQVVVIADQAVADLHWLRLRENVINPGSPLDAPPGSGAPLLLTFPSGEVSKRLATVDHLHNKLAAAQIGRDAVVIAFGGGVAGDLAGFVAATWLRGVRWIQVPTTLLAAIDASVGGKTGVNLPAGKNLVGAFHQPAAVIIDTDFLTSLPRREFWAGLGESVKHAAVRDPGFFAWHEQNASDLIEDSVRAVDSPDAGLLSELIARNCAIKADIVARDEREADLRAILNHGHTIGHALEHLLDYEFRHGECVALGMLVENEIARARGLLNPAAAARIARLLADLELPVDLPRRLDPADVLAACRIDKKVRGGEIHFILLEALGRPVRVTDVTEPEVGAALSLIQPKT